MATHLTTAERLLEQAPRLRDLARQLVKDPHTADDLVQETWLTAIQRPLPDGLALRAWLATVLRNLARAAIAAGNRAADVACLVFYQEDAEAVFQVRGG
jgi:DNA-directed RNA polymerase specialized sigma24 family protein